MSNITDFSQILNKKVNSEQIKDFKNILEGIHAEALSENFIEAMIMLLSLEDDTFETIAVGVLQSFKQGLNSPNERLLLTQSFLSSGVNSNQLNEIFIALCEALDKENGFSTKKKDFLKEMFGTMVSAVAETEGISNKMIQLPVEFCRPEAKMPQYAFTSDSGMDVFALDDYTINPGETKLVPTGLKFDIPLGYEIQIRPKSGRSLKTKLRIANTPATVDAGYREEVQVIVENIEPPIKDITYEFDANGKPVITSILHGSAFTIGKGEKFCQLVLMEVPKAATFRVQEVSRIENDRTGGFGSTGLK